jgi:hypothetical protein
MRRLTITFDEKVNVRFVRRAQTQCWWWTGSLLADRPAINLRHVTRYLYERDVAPIPPGMRLYRTDHTPDCKPFTVCAHYRCVNPWHLRLGPGNGGIYERAVSYDTASSERSAIRKRRVRANRRDKENADDDASPELSQGLAPD